MKKQVVIKILYVLLYVLIVCALSALFAYKEWSTLLFITVIFIVSLKILGVYPGNKYDDVSISQLIFNSEYGADFDE